MLRLGYKRAMDPMKTTGIVLFMRKVMLLRALIEIDLKQDYIRLNLNCDIFGWKNLGAKIFKLKTCIPRYFWVFKNISMKK